MSQYVLWGPNGPPHSAAERDWGVVKSTLATCGCRVVTHDQLVAEGGSEAADRASDDLRRQAITAAGWMTLIDAE